MPRIGSHIRVDDFSDKEIRVDDFAAPPALAAVGIDLPVGKLNGIAAFDPVAEGHFALSDSLFLHIPAPTKIELEKIVTIAQKTGKVERLIVDAMREMIAAGVGDFCETPRLIVGRVRREKVTSEFFPIQPGFKVAEPGHQQNGLFAAVCLKNARDDRRWTGLIGGNPPCI